MCVGGGQVRGVRKKGMTVRETAGWLEDAKDGVLEASVLHAAHSWRDLEAGRFTLSPVSPAGNVRHLQVCVSVCSE